MNAFPKPLGIKYPLTGLSVVKVNQSVFSNTMKYTASKSIKIKTRLNLLISL